MVSVLAFYMRILVRISLKSTICVKLLVNNKNREKETGIVVIKKCLILAHLERHTNLSSVLNLSFQFWLKSVWPRSEISLRTFFL